MKLIYEQIGFNGEAEFHRMVSGVDLSTNEAIQQFKTWQEIDGTKEGLMKLPQETIKVELHTCCICGSSDNTHYEGTFYGWRCNSPNCITF